MYMKEEEVIYTLIEDIVIGMSDGNQQWDKGERFILVDSEKKRHGVGRYPKRLISLSDGSMIAFSVIEKMEKALGRWVKTYKVFEEVK